ncbi:N-methyl-L-tryptophan oxidase [Alkalihalobacillus sp. LMS6]|uniref:N-methyl-L-tryptophan oxidase n=1 Tax=Alkalihalobacillus sp. LMS6 TaxID=2924034 RepID=UPI0020D04B96|nr:N-methyl-L-tryptophan oxidase [Alkalihalobacillus sp. LMS6]UTR05949.1 N-methyl-L-tryptophan oxidase [Alkalihalobacillus sp. LMS6]
MQYDVLVVGAGSMGMAAGYFLAKSGKRVLLLDSSHPPHQRGSHHGETRIIRHAYAEGSLYVPFVLRAQELWTSLERESGKSLFLKTGVLSVGKEESKLVQGTLKSAEAYQLPLEVLNANDIHHRYPGVNVQPGYVGCFEPNSGVLRCEESIDAYRTLAESYGATIIGDTSVQDVEIHKDSVTVFTKTDTYNAHSLVVTSGAWAQEMLAKLDLTVPLTPLRKTFAWYNADERHYGSEQFPAFAFETENGLYYGFPSIDGAGLKVGRHDGGVPVNPNHDLQPFGARKEDEEDLHTFLRHSLPKVGNLTYGKTCLYTMTPDDRFIIDRHPRHEHVAIAAGFSGHGFKFSSAVGQALSQLIISGNTDIDLSAFSCRRFNLNEYY